MKRLLVLFLALLTTVSLGQTRVWAKDKAAADTTSVATSDVNDSQDAADADDRSPSVTKQKGPALTECRPLLLFPTESQETYLPFFALNSLTYFSGFALNSSRQPLQQT